MCPCSFCCCPLRSLSRARSVEIKDPIAAPGGDSVPATLSDVKVEVDGESVGMLPVAFSVVPAAMEVIV